MTKPQFYGKQGCATYQSQSLVRSHFDTIEVIDSGKLIQKVNIPFD